MSKLFKRCVFSNRETNEAINYAIKACQIADKIESTTLKSRCYQNLACTYHEANDYNNAEKNYIKALSYQREDEDINFFVPDPSHVLLKILVSLGNCI